MNNHAKALALAAAFVAVSTGAGQIAGPTEVTVRRGEKNVAVEVSVTADSAEYLALGNLEMIREFSRATNKLVIRVLTSEAGEGYVVVAAVKGGEMLPLYRCLVRVVEPGPAPKPPGPGPTPTPVPPDPKPPDPGPTPTPVDPVPFPADGLHVLIVHETGKDLPIGQRAVVYGKPVRDYLDRVGAKYRVLDKDQDASKDTPSFAAAMRVKRDSIPWVVISNGKTGYSGPLPKDAGEFQTLVERYAK